MLHVKYFGDDDHTACGEYICRLPDDFAVVTLAEYADIPGIPADACKACDANVVDTLFATV